MIGKITKQLRKKLKLTQIEFAIRVDVGLRFLRELEQGKPTVRLDKLNQVLDFLGYHLEVTRNTEDYNKVINKFKYGISFNKVLKEKIRKRDGYRCQICGITQKKYKEKSKKHLSIHHIDEDKENNKEWNLISLCQKCHGRVNKNKEAWMQFFKNIVSI